MNKLPGLAILAAIIFLILAFTAKFVTIGRLLCGPMLFNWAKLADTFLLLSIALSLLYKNNK